MKSPAGGGEGEGFQSHPARGAWIEISGAVFDVVDLVVAPRKGCVD